MGVALSARRARHPKGEEFASYAAEGTQLELAEFGTAMRGEVCDAMVRRGLMVRRVPMEDTP